MLNEFRFYFLLSWLCLLSACGSTPSTSDEQPDNFSSIFKNTPKLSSFEEDINAILSDIKQKDFINAETKLSKLSNTASTSSEELLLQYAQTKYYIANDEWDLAQSTLLNASTEQNLSQIKPSQQLSIRYLRLKIASHFNDHALVASEKINIYPLLTTEKQAPYAESIWDSLQLIEPDKLQPLMNDSYYKPNDRLWYELTAFYIANDAIENKIANIENFRNQHTDHASQRILPKLLDRLSAIEKKLNQIIAIILPLQGKYASFAQAVLDGYFSAYYKSSFQPNIKIYSAESDAEFTAAYKQAVSDGASAIIGPLLKPQLATLYQYSQVPVPTYALNKIESAIKPSQLYEFTLSSDDEIQLMVKAAINYQVNNAFIIHQTDETSVKNMNTFIKLWKASNKNVASVLAVTNPSDIATKIEEPLNITKSKSRIDVISTSLNSPIESTAKARNDIDSVFIFANFDSANATNSIVQFYYPNIRKFATSSIFRGFADKNTDAAIDSIIFTDIALVNKTKNLPSQYSSSALIRLFALGNDAFLIHSNIDNSGTYDGATGNIKIDNGAITRTPQLYQVKKQSLQPISIEQTIE